MKRRTRTMKRFFILSICAAILASFTLQAQEGIYERAYVHTDKSCYLAGEEVWMKLYVTDAHFHPSSLSKVGYVEIVDTKHPFVQLKLALEDGSGAGKLKIPTNVPSGNYQLTAYTRYMRNEGEEVFFRKQIAIVNAFHHSPDDRIQQMDSIALFPATEALLPATETTKYRSVQITTDRKNYNHRMPVSVTIDGLPADITDLTLSVVCNDSLVAVPAATGVEAWRAQVTALPKVFSGRWAPEYEGHIIQGRLSGQDGANVIPTHTSTVIYPSIAFVGKNIRYIQGQTDAAGMVSFYTANTYGTRELVATVRPEEEGKTANQLTIVSPFSEAPSTTLPPLVLCPNKEKWQKRSIGVQLQQIFAVDSLHNKTLLEDLPCYHFKPQLSFDLDEYTRFPTMEETIIEFVRRVIIRKTNDKRRLRVLKEGEKRYNQGNTLVLLDGIPLFDHEYILNYDPKLVKMIDIYSGRYIFGGETFECMVAFTTQKGNLPAIQLDELSQLIVYECPVQPITFNAPQYPNDAARKSREADFRHTLYWNPAVEATPGSPTQLSFYTSDLDGEYRIIAEGFTKTGEPIRGEANFFINN